MFFNIWIISLGCNCWYSRFRSSLAMGGRDWWRSKPNVQHWFSCFLWRRCRWGWKSHLWPQDRLLGIRFLWHWKYLQKGSNLRTRPWVHSGNTRQKNSKMKNIFLLKANLFIFRILKSSIRTSLQLTQKCWPMETRIWSSGVAHAVAIRNFWR